VAVEWREAGVDRGLEELLQTLSVTLIATSPSREYEVLGSAFILMAQKRFAVCLTAAHVIRDAARVQQPRDAQARRFEFQMEQTLVDIDRTRLRAIWNEPTHPRACVIAYAWTAASSDLSFFVATFGDEDEGAQFPSMSCSIDWRPPRVGQELAVFGCVAQWISDQELSDEGGGFTLSKDFALRKGTVLALNQGRGRLAQGPSFELSVPFPPGLSGAPVIDVPKGGAPLTIRGIVCADLSPVDAYSDTTVAGLGTAMMIWPALGFRVPGFRFPGIHTPDALLHDLLRIGAIGDRSGHPKGVSVERTSTGATVTLRPHIVSLEGSPTPGRSTPSA
jgi:Trypsin-like peptidase domain